MHAVTSNSAYDGNGYAGSASPSTGYGPGVNAGAPFVIHYSPFATDQGYYKPGNPPTQLTPPRPGAQDYWNKYPQSSPYPQSPHYPPSCDCPPPPSRPAMDFNHWLQTTAPKPFNPCKIYQPGDQVIYNGNVYQAPNQGGVHCNVWPTTDCSKWLYHGSVVDNYHYYVNHRPKNE
jgi:hypothetical protein